MQKWMLLSFSAVCSVGYAGELADLHKKTVGATSQSLETTRNQTAVDDTKHGVTEIGLERTRCFGTCPAYTVIIKSDGTLRYKGEAFAKKLGEHKGKIAVWQFNKLAQFIKDVGYMNLESTYSGGVSDSTSVYTTVVMNGDRKVIENYASAGPTRLWAIEELIDKLLLEAQWADEKGK